MKMQVFQIDAWSDGEGGWTYNNSTPLRKVYIEGEPTKRKILNALRRNEILTPAKNDKYYLDDSFTYDGTWCLQRANDYMPLFDLQEMR